MKKILLATVLLASAAFAPTAYADTNISAGAGAEAGASAGASAGANSTSNFKGSVGLPGLAGGSCSEGLSLGAGGAGLGFSALNRACVLNGQIEAAVKSGLISKAEGRAFWLATAKSLGFELVATSN